MSKAKDLSILVPARFVFIMWLTFVVDGYFTFSLKSLGIIPRSLHGLPGIFFSPFLHGDIGHLISNTIPVLFLGWTLFYFYHRIAKRVFYMCFFGTNILVWLFGRLSIHIGASGLIYGLASFLIFYGIFRKDIISLIISIIVVLLYGGMMYGVLPLEYGVSWESHLSGALIGLLLAMSLSKVRAS